VDISAHPPRVTPLVIGLDLTCGYYEDVCAGSEWDIVNVSSPTMTPNHLLVNLSLDTEGAISVEPCIIGYRIWDPPGSPVMEYARIEAEVTSRAQFGTEGAGEDRVGSFRGPLSGWQSDK